MKISKKSLIYFLVMLLIGIIATSFIKTLPADESGIKKAALLQLIVFIICFIYFGKVNKNMVTLYSVFILIFFLFQNGQLILYSLGIKYDYFYVERYSKEVLLKSIYFSTACMCSAFAAGMFSFSREHKSKLFRKMNSLDHNNVLKTAKIGYLFSIIVAYINVIIKFVLVVSSGYFSVMAYTATIPSIIKVIEEFFVAFTIMIIIYEQKNKMWIYSTTIFFIIWSLLTALTGDRTSGIAGIVIIGIIYFKNIYKNKKIKFVKKQKNVGKYLALIIVAIIAMYLISFAFSFRMQYSYSKDSLLDTIIYTIGTLGFSFFPLVLVMQICPSIQSFLYGKSLLGGLISGFIPNSIDLFGLTHIFLKWSSEPSTWIDLYYNYGFGIDFSLNAECYVNFGYWGWIAMFFLCVIIASFLRNIDFNKRDNLFSQYSGLTLLFTWFTLPRRKSYYIYNKIFWYVLVMALFLIIVRVLLKKKSIK